MDFSRSYSAAMTTTTTVSSTEPGSVPATANSSNSSLQITVLIVSVACQMLAVCLISSTLSKYTDSYMYVYVGIMVFAIVMIIIWMIAFIGAVNENYVIIYFVWGLWLAFTLFWIFFISGCITPTICPESLWLINNQDHAYPMDDSKPEFYYHDYHRHFPDNMQNDQDVEGDQILDYEDIPYIVHYEPFITFLRFYKPWSSKFGAVAHIVCFLVVLAFFLVTLRLLKRYADQIVPHQIERQHQSAVCSCSLYINNYQDPKRMTEI